ncbi:MAG: hypothetical protein AAGC88_00740 [Bacteroidota bacterium]
MSFKRITNSALLLVMALTSHLGFSQDSEALFKEMKYRNVGPNRAGRATAVTGVESEPGTFYMGASGGGVWKTTDYGTTWNNVSDGHFATPSIGEIRVVQSDPNIVYVGTGSDGLRSNVIPGKGVYKSTDAGATWEHIGLKEAGQIGSLEVHPDDPNTVFVGAIGSAFIRNEMRGLYRTSDGGKNWEKIFYHSDSIGVADFEFAPDDPNTMYATLWRAERKPWTIISGSTEGGVYKSTDGGKTWNKSSNGLPSGLIGKIDLAVSAAAPDKIFAIVEAPEDEGGFYVSEDRGATWTQLSTDKALTNRPFYYTNLDANPKNANSLFSNANRFKRSFDGGKTWTNYSTPHGDNHGIWQNPSDTSIWAQVNDGGANVTTNDGKTWSTQFNQPTAELYTIEVDDQYPYWMYAGQQDNYTTVAVPSRPPYGVQAGGNAWIINTGGCETGPAVPKPGNHNIVYSDCKGRFGVYDKRTGQEKQYYVGATNMYGHNPKDLKYRFQRVSPIHVSPHNPDVVYHTSQYVHKTTDDGVTWEQISPDLTAFEADKQVVPGAPITRDVTGEEYYSTIYAIRESPVQAGVIWTGANDGPVHVTQDAGANWSNVTPGMPGGGRVDCVEPSPHSAGKAYFTSLRYMFGDNKPYIYKTADFGKSWTLISEGNGIPEDFPVRVVREDPAREGLLYAGTEFGMFVSLDDGANWSPFQQNLPVTPITDIKVVRNGLALSTMGRSFWVMDDVTPLHQLNDEVAGKSAHLFKPDNTVKYVYRGNNESASPHYPAPAAVISYHLAEVPEGDIMLEIMNGNGDIINSYSSAEGSEGNGGRNMSTGFFGPSGKASLTKVAGINRFNWDMKHMGAWSSNARRSGLGGPSAAPGIYTAKLTVGGESMSESFEILIDPRVESGGTTVADLKEQEALSAKIVALQTEANKFLAEVKEARKATKSKKKSAQLADLEAELVMQPGIYMQPMLTNQIGYLASMLKQADQKPGKDAYDRYEELKSKLASLKEMM